MPNAGPPLPDAFLLDLDDTILADSSNVSECWKEACLSFGPELGDAGAGNLYDAVERTRNWYWADPSRHRVGRLDLEAARREVVSISLAGMGVDEPELAERIARRYGLLRDLGVHPLPGSIETLRWLRERGCRLALLTNGSAAGQRRKIDRFGLSSLFEAILIEGELGYGKPDTRVYQQALRELGVAPARSWMAGDNLEWDVAGPQRLGIFGIWIDLAGAGLPPGNGVRPNRIVRSLAELRDPAAGRAGETDGHRAGA